MARCVLCRQAAEAKAKYCASRVVRGIDFTRTGSYVEYDKPGSVADCCHACATQQARALRCCVYTSSAGRVTRWPAAF